MCKLSLQIADWGGNIAHPVGRVTEALPFVENSRGHLNHRPKYVNVHKNGRRPYHMSVHYYCDNQTTGTDNITFLDEPSSLLCEICELRATMAGLPTADEIVGRHVHVGRMKPIQVCCQEGR